jgi:hypothetical protein
VNLPLSVRNKKNFFDRWINLEFGNRQRAWNTLSDLLDSDYTGCVSIRFAVSCVFNVQHYVPKNEVVARIKDIGWEHTSCRFNESPDDTRLIFQGEVMDDEQGLYVLYSTEQLPMRKALESCAYSVTGLAARMLLKHWMCPSSYADLCSLLELYPGHVIEFSTFTYNLGELAHRNTIIWEVRKY